MGDSISQQRSPESSMCISSPFHGLRTVPYVRPGCMVDNSLPSSQCSATQLVSTYNTNSTLQPYFCLATPRPQQWTLPTYSAVDLRGEVVDAFTECRVLGDRLFGICLLLLICFLLYVVCTVYCLSVRVLNGIPYHCSNARVLLCTVHVPSDVYNVSYHADMVQGPTGLERLARLLAVTKENATAEISKLTSQVRRFHCCSSCVIPSRNPSPRWRSG